MECIGSLMVINLMIIIIRIIVNMRLLVIFPNYKFCFLSVSEIFIKVLDSQQNFAEEYLNIDIGIMVGSIIAE